MRTLKRGVTLIELLIYMGLLSIVAISTFGLVLQVNKQNKGLLEKHIAFNASQIALDIIVRDIRNSRAISIEAKRNYKFNLACFTEQGIIRWQLDNDNVLFRIDPQTKYKKKATSKVAENITEIIVSLAKRRLKSDQIERGKLIYLKIKADQAYFKKAIMLRQTLNL